jgi:DNA-directed RNA polymerase subunit L
MVGEPSLIVQTDGKDPVDAVQDAIERVQATHDDFLDAVDTAV